MIKSVGLGYIRAVVLAVIIVLTVSIFMPSGIAVAEEGTGYAGIRENYENTDVLDDLEGVDLTKYQGLKTVSIISFNEFGYIPEDMSGYGLYIYVYNDTGNQIINYKLNRVQISTDGSVYNKYRVTILDNTDDFTVYKLKVEDTASIGAAVNAEQRTYHVSGIELTTTTGLTDYAISSIYKYTGTPALEDGAESTLSCTVEQQDTVIITGLEDRQTVYRTDMDNPNMQSHNQINSVYFAVDNYFMHTYGKLQQIEAEWWEYRTSPIVVTNNEELYTWLMVMSSNYSAENPLTGHICDEDWGLGLIEKDRSLGNYTEFAWSYNIYTYGSHDTPNSVVTNKCIENLYWILNTDQWGVDLDNYVISQEKLAARRFDFEQSQRAHFSEEDNGYSYCLELFNEEVGEGRTAGYNRKIFDSSNPDDMIDFKEYDPNYRGWDAFKNIFGWEDDFDEVLTDVSPIVLIDSSNSEYYLSGRNEEIADKMLIAVEDVPAFKQYVQTSIINNETVVLFRFANTEYYSNTMEVFEYNEHVFHTASTHDDIAFTAEENVFLNFDIMTLGFYDGSQMNIIPVVSSPIDVISDIVGPALPDTLGDMIMYYILIAIAAIVAVLVLVLLYGILDMISNSVMSAPRRNTKNYNRRKRRR